MNNQDNQLILINKYKFALNFKIVFIYSVKKLLKSPLPYIAMIISIFIDLFIYVFLPYVTKLGDISRYYASEEWVILTMQSTFTIFALIGALIGEMNAIPNEKVYFLSKSIKRHVFLWAKCISSFIVAIIVSIPTLLILVGIVLFEWFGHGLNIFDVSRGENPYAIFGSFLMILLFGSFISTIWHYQTRGGISIIICFSLVLIYVIIFPMLTQLSNPSWAADFTDFLRFLWLLLPLPIYFLLLVSIGLPGIFIFMKSEVES